ncbi:MAG: hypothetical protein HY657_03840 [Acidobacteria bacterium]|nr:hypothetical protein [Acidobacteriota bacterium]
MGIAFAALVYAAVTAALFHNLVPDVSTHLYAYLGDPLLNAAILGWNAAHVPLTEQWWNFPSFAPLPGVTAFTEHLLLAYPIATPIIWATGNPVLAYNVVFLLAFPLNGVAAYALTREVTGSTAGALIGGLAFAFAPYQAVQMTHVQALMAFGVPLTLLGLHRCLHAAPAGGRRGLALFTVGWLCAALANAYTLVFVPVLVVLWCAWFVRPAEWRRLIPPAAAAVGVAIAIAPLLWGYHVRQSAYGLSRQYDEVRSFAADITGVSRIFHRSTFWRGIMPETFEEGAIFPGLTIVALAGIGVAVAARRGVSSGQGRPSFPSRRLLRWASAITVVALARVWTGPFSWHVGPLPLPPFRPYFLFTVAALLALASVALTAWFRRGWLQRDPMLFYASAAVIVWLLALGPEPEWSTPWRALWVGPYRLLMALPGLDSIRVPARAWQLAALCLALLAGAGAAALARRFPRLWRVPVVVLAVAIVAEGWFSEVTVAAPRPMPRGAIPAGALVLDLPVEEGFWGAIPQYRAVLGGYRTINGYSGYEPPHFNPLRHAIADMRPDALAPYRADDLYLILRPGEDPAVARWIVTHHGAEHLFELGDAGVYRVPRLGSTREGR